MIKKILIIILLLSLITFINSLDVPDLKGYVNDYADMISSSAENELETKLKAFDDSDSTEIVILTVPSLEGDALEDFSIKVADEWKIGKKNKDNGAIFLVSKNDRKMRIEVGYGLEGVITDLLAGRIINNVATPYFRNGDMDKGFVAVIDALIGASKGEYTADKLPVTNNPKDMSFPFIILMFSIIMWFIFSRAIPFKLRGILGGVFGAASLSTFALFAGVKAISIIILSFIGLILGSIFTLIFTSAAIRTGSAGRSSGRFGGFSSGSGSGGFSSSGFSGGGGSFGGGGASGGW